jgi:predicted RNA-binding Zn ribbon-like protein
MTREPMAEPIETEELFVAFANTLSRTRGIARDTIPDAEALLDWLRANDLLSARGRATEGARLRRDPDEAERRLERFRELRSVLHAMSHSISIAGRAEPEQLSELNHVLRGGLHYHQLRIRPDGNRYEVSQIGDRLDQARAAIASSFAHFVADDAPDRLRVCANDGCGEVFVDRSPGGRRRWCDMRTCGNQAKVARHRARARELAAGVPTEPLAD